MKRRILFVIDSLGIGGAERSLVSLLSLLDYSEYEVDLQLFRYGGAFERYLPQEVHLLPPFDYTKYLNRPLIAQLFTLDWKKLYARVRFSLAIRKKGLLHSDRALLYWKISSRCIPTASAPYEVAIAYAQGVPTMYVVDKVKADKKFGWVNVNYQQTEANRREQTVFYERLSKIVTVSESVQDFLSQAYPSFAHKMVVVRDLVSPRLIQTMAQEPTAIVLKKESPILMTVSRLNGAQKGLDIAIEAARCLHERKVNFRWYVLGEGTYREVLESNIRKNHLEENFILLGAQPNPYPYMKQATIYVQTSRHEGYGLSIAEARLLNIPVVTTAYEGVYMQMIPSKNGVVVPIDVQAVADAIQQLLERPEQLVLISEFQKHEPKGNLEELKKFYQLIS
jgi:glycosyltransferase involved in cell wall biosynthesis